MGAGGTFLGLAEANAGITTSQHFGVTVGHSNSKETDFSGTVDGLSANTSYQFAVRAGSTARGQSIFSLAVTAKTLGGGSFGITMQPTDMKTYAGGEVTFSTQTQYLDESGEERIVSYQWQSYDADDGSWSDVNGAHSSSYTITSTAKEQSGQVYRCRAYYRDSSLYTTAAALTVDRASSSIAFSTATSQMNEKIYNASGFKVTVGSTATTVRTPITATKDSVFSSPRCLPTAMKSAAGP